jgi:hypothetical protein
MRYRTKKRRNRTQEQKVRIAIDRSLQLPLKIRAYSQGKFFHRYVSDLLRVALDREFPHA